MMAALLLCASLHTALPETVGDDFERAVLSLTGAAEMEELNQNEISRFQHYAEHPVNLNTSSRSRLLSTELLSAYQVASLIEYRSRNGDILSMTELALVDGFNPGYVKNLLPFISLTSTEEAGQRQRTYCPQTIRLQSGLKREADMTESCWLKYSGEFGSRVEVNWSEKINFPSPEIGIGTIGAAVYGNNILGKIIIGNYNARFGQGLALWSGTTRSGFSTATSLVKNGSGISLTQSFSPDLRGLAVDISLWGFDLALGYGDCGIAFFSAEKTGRIWKAGVTALCYGDGLALTGTSGIHFSGRISGNFKCGFPGGAVFGEAAYETGGCIAALLGAFWIPTYGSKLSCLLRYYPSGFSGTWSASVRSATKVSDEHGITLGASHKWGDATFDAVWHPAKKSLQYKLIASLGPEFESGICSIKPSARLNVKYTRSMESLWRADARVQTDVKLYGFSVSARYNTVHSKDWSHMAYLEGGYDSNLRIFIRGGIFKADSWDDRIYVYEKDAPGNYNSPALYGRGWWTSLLAGLKIKKEKRPSHSVYLRASFTSYCLMTVPKPSRLELKFQYGIDF